ncbi:hypothetical protein K439DRAFT_1353831, partial [Ramaria rubella]
LHPHYKTLYFQRQKWPESWIDTTDKLLQDQWEQNYKPTWHESSNPSEVPKQGYFAELDTFSVLEGTDELDEYLGLPAQPLVSDPLTHWEAQKAGGSHLARMALDFLSIPGKSRTNLTPS